MGGCWFSCTAKEMDFCEMTISDSEGIRGMVYFVGPFGPESKRSVYNTNILGIFPRAMVLH